MASIDVRNSFTIDAPVDRVWEVMAERFTEVATWGTGILRSVPNDAVPAPPGAPVGGRICTVVGLGELDERITEFDRDAGRLSYTAVSDALPGFVRRLENVWTFTPAGDGGTHVTQELRGQLDGLTGAAMRPVLERRFRATLVAFSEDLIAIATTGRPSGGKAAELAAARR